jgi:hypothetical protein
MFQLVHQFLYAHLLYIAKEIVIVAIKERIDITMFAISIIHPSQYYTFQNMVVIFF